MGKKRGRRIVNSSNVSAAMPSFGELQRSVVPLINITPPQAGGQVVMTLPVGGVTYEKIVILNNIPEDQITEIKLSIDGKAVWEFDNAVQLRNLSKFYKETLHPATGTDKAMTFNFERLHLDSFKEKKALGIGSIDIQKLSISFKVDKSVSAPEVSAFAFVGKARPLGPIRIIRTVPFNSAVAGELAIVNPFLVNKANPAKVMAVHFSRNDIEKLEVVRGQSTTHTYIKSINKYHLLSANRVPNPNSTVIDFCNQNTIAGSLTYSDTTNDFITLKPVVTSAGACNMLVEYVGTLGSA